MCIKSLKHTSLIGVLWVAIVRFAIQFSPELDSSNCIDKYLACLNVISTQTKSMSFFKSLELSLNITVACLQVRVIGYH